MVCSDEGRYDVICRSTIWPGCRRLAQEPIQADVVLECTSPDPVATSECFELTMATDGLLICGPVAEDTGTSLIAVDRHQKGILAAKRALK